MHGENAKGVEFSGQNSVFRPKGVVFSVVKGSKGVEFSGRMARFFSRKV